MCTQFADYSMIPISDCTHTVFNGMRMRSALIAGSSILLHPLDVADHLIWLLRLNINFMKSKLNLPKLQKKQATKLRHKTGIQARSIPFED